MRHPMIYPCFSISQIVVYYLLNGDSPGPSSRGGSEGFDGVQQSLEKGKSACKEHPFNRGDLPRGYLFSLASVRKVLGRGAHRGSPDKIESRREIKNQVFRKAQHDKEKSLLF
jgi:hypothetical protein